MKDEKDYIRDIAEIRTMMERSSKFLSLSGWAGIMAGVYALAGAYVAYKMMGFTPFDLLQGKAQPGNNPTDFLQVVGVAVAILVLAIGSAVILSYRKAQKRGEKIWNATAKRVLITMAVPLVVGGLLALIFISKGLIAFVAPVTLLFYGLALFNASRFTYEEVRSLGLIQILLGLVSAYFVGYGLLFWALGFGFVHIFYGISIHYRYER
ncbi:hypothetical protein [Rufibacter sp. LB8]|uniref:hypothetical protein n=1 Tax=Rufibacter sp. LB8 TaxID=2777781 RepID=UPI00178C5479|nr:hypothetical protein [Rufibacter sp. LB8]